MLVTLCKRCASTLPRHIAAEPRTHVGVYRNGAVAADSQICSKVGRKLKKGNAVDAAIAAMLCVGVYHCHSAGVGGGGFALHYDRSRTHVSAYDFRPVTPISVNPNLYRHQPDIAKRGGLSVCVPGEIAGYKRLHDNHGSLPWAELFHPAIAMCENGFPVGYPMRKTAVRLADIIARLPHLRSICCDDTGRLLNVGDTTKLPKLAETLRKISSQNGADDFYVGSLSRDIVDDLTQQGGIIDQVDMSGYKVEERAPLVHDTGGHTVYSCPLPSGGPLVNYILNILKGYNLSEHSEITDSHRILILHRIIEAMKFAFAKRSQLGDDNFVDTSKIMADMSSPEYCEAIRQRINDHRTHGPDHYGASYITPTNHGTTHISVLDAAGNAVSLSSSIDDYFGSMVVGEKTGIIFNNTLYDFAIPGVCHEHSSLPLSDANRLEGGKKALSSMAPTIVLDERGDVSVVIGAAGGCTTLTQVALVLVRLLLMGDTLDEALHHPRIHHQLHPHDVTIETPLPRVEQGLLANGHTLRQVELLSVIQAISRHGDVIHAASDHRKRGLCDGY